MRVMALLHASGRHQQAGFSFGSMTNVLAALARHLARQMRRQFSGDLLHRSAHGLEDVWRELQAQRPDAQVETWHCGHSAMPQHSLLARSKG